MRLSVLIVGLLVAAPYAAAAQDAVSTSEPAILEAAGRYEEALAAYQRLAAGEARDHRVRLAIGRLQERLGHPDRAEAVFRSVVLEDPANLEARLGTARTLLEQLRPEEALDVLDAAETQAPEDPSVLAALGRAHSDAGHDAESVRYFERASSIGRTPAYQLSLERARRIHDHRIESRSFSESYSGTTPNARATDLAVNVRVSDSLRVSGRGQVQRKFGVDDARGGGGIEWRATPYTTVTAQALVGPDNVVMPTHDYLGEVAYSYGAFTSSGSVRYFDFDVARITTVSPALNWAATGRLSLALRYALSLTNATGLDSTARGHTAHLRGAYEIGPRVVAFAGYARGVDDFDSFSVDRIGAFRAHAGAVGVRVDLPTVTSVSVAYERQTRQNGVTLDRAVVSIAQRF